MIYVVIYILIIIMTFYFTSFLYFHILVLIYNVSTIEHIEKNKEVIYKIENNIFYNGKCKNISATLGCFLLWLLPIAHKPLNDGYSFEVNKDIYDTVFKVPPELEVKKSKSTPIKKINI
jgi:hypothetical protein